jgi:hypothetical protein
VFPTDAQIADLVAQLERWPRAEAPRLIRAAVASWLDAPDAIERLAAQAHVSWAGWTRWMLAKWGQAHASGEPYADRWRRQVATPYADLSADEQESDRIEARAYVDRLLGREDR